VKKIYRVISKKAVKKGDHSLLVVTTKANLSKYVDEVTSDNYEYYRICGLCVLDEDMKDKVINGIKVVANKDELLSYVCHNWVDDVFFGIPYNDVPSELLDGLSMAGISMMFELTNAKSLQGRSHEIKTLYDESILCSTIHPRNDFEIVIKRMMDIIGSLLGIIILALLIIIIGPIIYLKSPGPIFYFQERVGKNGNIFKIYKFRSMVLNADELKDDLLKDNRIKDGMMFKVENDPRIIPGIGTFIRKTSIDEFPQFINVLKGEMSLVGTRPPTLDEWQKYNLGHRIRMTIKPGITGAWQTSGRSEITDFEEVLKMDREYINNWSISLDIKILIKTIYVIIFRKKDAM